ncbi:MAG: flagellar basal body rod protein FlgC [Planctomycetota bacterium]
MSIDSFFSALDVSASGLVAERTRLDVVAQNLANADVTRGQDGQPYRRREVLFQALLDDSLDRDDRSALAGVAVTDVVEDLSPFRRVLRPGHPHADAEGYVLMPNVDTAFEMVDLMMATRSYEANAAAMRSFRQMVEQTLAILR